MTGVSIPLESLRLARYAHPIPCYVCNEGNPFDADRCRHCQAPLALTYQAAMQKTPPEMLAVLAPAGAGKTSFLGLLTDMLARQHGELQMMARGAFSVALQQAAITSLGGGYFPRHTAAEADGWNWVHCRVTARRLKRPADLVIPDVSGRVIAEEVEHPNSQPIVAALLQRCRAAMILLDTEALAAGDRTSDFFAMKCISYLSELDGSGRTWRNRPVAFVFTKSDCCEEVADDPEACAERLVPGMWQLGRQLLARFAFFSVAVTGAVARQRRGGSVGAFPLRVEPRGVVEPFAWLLTEMTPKSVFWR